MKDNVISHLSDHSWKHLLNTIQSRRLRHRYHQIKRLTYIITVSNPIVHFLSRLRYDSSFVLSSWHINHVKLKIEGVGSRKWIIIIIIIISIFIVSEMVTLSMKWWNIPIKWVEYSTPFLPITFSSQSIL